MPWSDRLWSRSTKTNDDKGREAKPSVTQEEPPSPIARLEQQIHDTKRLQFSTSQTALLCIATTATTLASIRLYKTYFRRIPNVNHIKPDLFRRRGLYGYVTSVGDGDNFRLFHTPGGRLAGWGWLPSRRVQDLTRPQLKDRTVHVRIAGVDAPECAHFGRPAQPYGKEAMAWLGEFVEGRFVRAEVLRRDQYERVVCMVSRRRWWVWKTDVGLEMLRRGWATVYEAKFGSEFGEMEGVYRAAEKRAREKGVGMWKGQGVVGSLLGRQGGVETPREFKNRMVAEEKKQDVKTGAKAK